MAEKIKFYGNPLLPGWQEKYLTSIVPPFQMYYEHKPIKSIRVHKKCADAFMSAFHEIWDKCGHDQKKVDATGASDFGGTFNIRKIAGSSNLSNHSFGCAIDLSPSTNGFNTKVTTLSKVVIDAFKKQGFRWGGDYKHRTDPMHFEAVS